jgi:hypothetical protein
MPNSNATAGYNQGTATVIFTGSFTGVPNNGSISRVASTDGLRYTAVGNPYPSPIGVAAFFAQNQDVIDGSSALYFWRKRNNTTVSSYATLTLAAYTANSATDGGSDQAGYFTGSNVNWLISQGQGFIVKTKDNPTSTQIHFTNAMRRAAPANGNQAFLRTAHNNTAAVNNASRLWLNLTGEQNSFCQAAVAYLGNVTTGIDYGYDGRSLTDGGSISLYSIANDTNLAVQARPAFEVSDVVPMGYSIEVAGHYTVSLDHTDGLFTGDQDIYLKDNVSGLTHNLKDGDYTFTTGSGTFNDRFELVYTTDALGATIAVLTGNDILIYKERSVINVSCTTENITGITIYDVRGQKLYYKTNINAATAVINNLQVAQQVLIIEVTTLKGKISKRLVY